MTLLLSNLAGSVAAATGAALWEAGPPLPALVSMALLGSLGFAGWIMTAGAAPGWHGGVGETAVAALGAAAGAVRSVADGVVGTAVIQAVIMAIDLAVAGVPGAMLLGFVTLLLAPSQIGAPLIIVCEAAQQSGCSVKTKRARGCS